MKITINLEHEGLNCLFKPYQKQIMEYLWNSDKPEISRDVWQGIGPETISRASVINTLNWLADIGVLTKTEKTGKGGHRGLYTPALTEDQILIFAGNTALDKLGRYPK